MNTIFPDIQLRTLKLPMNPDELLATLRSNVPSISPHEISGFLQNVHHDLDVYDKLIHHIHTFRGAMCEYYFTKTSS
ncbi:hypothetical protein L218DRAFT_770417 [Marasmius fiardii PR-910]|nr:hypothetical protein L218DRAFT_770417 [Marasmius fiardii PR-910]